MKRFFLAAAAALSLAACADVGPSPVEPAAPRFAIGDRWNIFTTQTPAETLDAAPGWEVATRFKTSVDGCVVAMRFWRAEGETGSNTLKLWTDSGILLGEFTRTFSSSGWKTILLRRPIQNVDDSICIFSDTYYRVSVNTNNKQVKTYGYFNTYGPIVRGPLTADAGYYGQPTGSMPTQHSGSIFFVDVTFEEGWP